jgi:hypothetical protein
LIGIGRDVNALVDKLVDATLGVISRVEASLPGGFPERVFGAIAAGLQKSAGRLAAQRELK